MFINEQYTFHFVCLACRRSIKRAANIRWASQMRGEVWNTPSIRCGQCGEELLCMGRKFAAPKRRDDAGWKKLAWMIENGWRGGSWPVTPTMNLNQVRESLRAAREKRIAVWQRVKEESSFEEAKRRARRNARKTRTGRKRARLELKAQRQYQDAVLARVPERKPA